MSPEPMLTPEQVGPQWLGVPIKTLYKWRAEGRGPVAVRVGRHLRYTRQAVEDWLNDQRAS